VTECLPSMDEALGLIPQYHKQINKASTGHLLYARHYPKHFYLYYLTFIFY
jgi:hypothetical protein